MNKVYVLFASNLWRVKCLYLIVSLDVGTIFILIVWKFGLIINSQHKEKLHVLCADVNTVKKISKVLERNNKII